MGVDRPHLLRWGDAYADYLVCRNCGIGFAPTAKVLDLLNECPAFTTKPRLPEDWT